MTRPRALLFDLDGTLVDSRRDIAAACNAALAVHGRSKHATEAILPMIGDGARVLVTRALSLSGAPLPSELFVDQVLASFKAYYLAHPCVHSVLLPGAREVLDEAHAAGLPCALVTNKPRDVTLLLIEALGIAPRFAEVWGAGDGPLKPAPDSVLSVLSRLGVAAADAWMVGDGPQDIGAGKAAGCYTVAVPGIAEHDRLLASGPDLVLTSLHDLRAELQRLTPA